MEATDVVISGIGALCPQSSHLQEFGRNLLDNKDLTTETTRWKYDDTLNVSTKCGQIPYHHFDSVFFGVNQKLAINMDPVSKLSYVRSYEAILDAGLHPRAMRGKNVCVITGSGINEFESKLLVTPSSKKYEGYPVMGLSRTMSPNRISYMFDFRGPSCTVSCTWEDAHFLLQQASESIREGDCEAALVVAAHLNRYPNVTALFRLLGLASGDGATKSFDRDGCGSAQSDGAIAFFLQRGDHAKRCYAKVLAADVQYVGDYGSIHVCLPSPRGIERFLSRLYRSHHIDPKRIVYLEADGCGDPIRDECELNAIDAALVKGCGRSEPLLVGSVKSNLGSTGAVTGFAAICKAIVAMESGIIPATINHEQPNPRAAGLVEGRLKVTKSNTLLQLPADGVVAVNTMGVGATLGHSVLEPGPRQPQAPQDPADHLPRLMTISGRSQESVEEVIKKIRSTPFDTNFYRLVQDVFSENIRGYDYRSYVICPSPPDEVPPVMLMEKRSLWFVYSGMGSQWAGMGAGLMCLPVFAETIERLHAVLQTKGLDLKAILTETGPEAFDNILKSFVGITACQIALTNVLTTVGLVPDGIIGHSVGELGCAYADGCLTEKQAILAAWARGVASNEATLIKGMMAAIGLGHKDVLPRLPPTIDVACHNSDTSCTLSGPAEEVERFVKQLSDEGVFARAVNVSDIAYHSRYIQPAAPFLREKLQQVIPVPKRRSDRWVSTSVPQDKLETDLAKFCSAEYQTNNLLSPVLFEEGLASIPKHSLLVEVAPHGLLQAILKRALPEPTHIALTQRGHPNPLHFLLNAIGKTSFGGVGPKVARLYPDVEFPVPRGTASLAQLVTTQADASTYYEMLDNYTEKVLELMELNHDLPHMFLRGKRSVLISDILMLMWRCVVRVNLVPLTSCPVTFRNIQINDTKEIPAQGDVEELRASHLPGTTQIEVLDDAGRILALALAQQQDDTLEVPPPLAALDDSSDLDDGIVLTKEELYGHLAAHGLKYSPRMQNIASVQMGDHDWLFRVGLRESWGALFEAVLQIFMLRALDETQTVALPKRIQRIDIDPTKTHKNTEVVLRLNLATGVIEGPGLRACGFLPSEAQASAETTASYNSGHEQCSPCTRHLPTALTTSSLDDVKFEFLGANPLGCSGARLSGHVDYVGVLKASGKADGARVMGVGQWLGDHLRPRLDPLLRWPVPKEWSAAEAATVPFAYATMYHALVVKAQAGRSESILVQEGASALGQAAIRVAMQLGCRPIYTTVRDNEDRALLRKTFPQLDPSNMMTCGGETTSFEWGLRLRTHNEGVRVVVNTLAGRGLHASMRCLGYHGRILHHQREDMLAARTIGSSLFIKSTGFYGFSGNELFRATDKERTAVFEAVSKGIESGTVRPIVGARACNALNSTASLDGCSKALVDVSSVTSGISEQCDPHKCYLIAGRQASDALLVAARLSLLGARNVLVAVESPPSSALVRQRQRALRRQHGTALHVLQVRGWSTALAGSVVDAAAAVAPVHTAVVVVKDDGDVAVPGLLSEALSSGPNNGVGLVLLAERAEAASSLATLVERRNAAGRRTVCLAAPLAEAADHLVELLCAPPAPKAVTVLPSANAVASVAGSHPGDCVPTEPAALKALGRAVARVSGLRLRQLPSLGPIGRANKENFPLYALPPLGVLDQDSERQVTGLAARLFSSVVVVETALRPAQTLRDAASCIVEAILARQPLGPYNVLGWRLSTVLALEVQRQLEAAGKRGVLFLVHGDVGLVRQWAQQQSPTVVASNDSEVQRGAAQVNALVDALAEHQSELTKPFSWFVKVIRASVDDMHSLDEYDPQLQVKTLTTTDLANSSLSHVVNDSCSWSRLAGDDDLRLTISLFPRKC